MRINLAVTFLSLFLPSALLIGGGGYLYANAEIHFQQEPLANAEQSTMRLATHSVRQTLRRSRSDMAFLTNLPQLRAVLRKPSAANITALEASVSNYMDFNPDIDQVRWLGLDGKERIRVSNKNGTVSVTPKAALQNKDERAYFKAALALPKAAIYLSEFDLNIENGAIKVPYRPTYRMALSIVNTNNQEQGVFVVNFSGNALLDELTQSIGTKNKQVMLVNRNGFFMRTPHMDDLWGFMRDKPQATLAVQAPSTWAAIYSQPEGQRLGAQGLWSWNHIQPLVVVNMAAGHASPKDVTFLGESDYQWHSVSLLPSATLVAVSDRVWRQLTPILGLLMALAALGSAAMTYSIRRIKLLSQDLAQRAQAAEAAGIAKANFLANMSHEIRSPMNAILGLTHVLARMDLSADALDLNRKVSVAGRSLLRIVNDILDYSKIDAGRLDLESMPFRLDDVMDNLAVVMSSNSKQEDVELVIAPPSHDLGQLMGDAMRLEQVLINLTGNALKFTESGHIEVKVAVISEEGMSVTLRFSVNDTGIGISAEQQGDIFAPFSQADGSITRRFGGTGLGLSISRRLVEMMGGTMGLNSTPGQGSQFWFTVTFPRTVTQRLSQPHMAQLTVLIADDSEVALGGLTDTVRSLGWAPTAVGSGQEAIQLATRSNPAEPMPAVILMDWKMPGIDGLAAAKTIRESARGGESPILIMVTAQRREDLLADPDSALVDGILTKPATASTLYNAVNTAALARQGKQPATPRVMTQRLAGLRLLVVDDADINIDVARRIFEDEGAEVQQAENGQIALDWLIAHPQSVDLVLMDIQMPVMDGMEATRRIRTVPSLKTLPIVALTAGAFKTHRDEAKAAGMDEFLAKPFDVDLAVTTIQTLTQWTPKQALPAPSSGSVLPPPTPHEPVTPTALDLPGLNITQGLSLWRDAVVYRQYLRTFATSYHDVVAVMAKVTPPEAAALVHKLKGAAANLALHEVARCAGEANQVFTTTGDRTAPLAELQSAMDTALESIQHYAADEAPDPTAGHPDLKGAEGPENRAALTRLLARALAAIGTDDPSQVEPLLTELARHLPQDRLVPLVRAIENFDFRAAKTAVEKLAADFKKHKE